MKKTTILSIMLGVSAIASAEIEHRFMGCFFNQGKARIIAQDGSVEWEMPGLRASQDAWVLENGNYLFSHRGGAKEVTPGKKVVWEYTAPDGVEVHSVQPIEENKILVCECGTKRLLEVQRGSGEIVKEIPLESPAKTHGQFRTARKSSTGTYWVAYLNGGRVCELDGTGNVLRTIQLVEKGWKHAHSVRILKNGHILTSTAMGGGVKEFDENGALVWDLSKEDLMAAGLKKVAYIGGVERLKNGNTLIAGYGCDPQFFEITPEKKMVWSFNNPELGHVAGIRLLGEE